MENEERRAMREPDNLFHAWRNTGSRRVTLGREESKSEIEGVGGTPLS